MLNQKIIEAAIRNRADLPALKRMIQVTDDSEVIEELFKYIRLTVRNYFRTNTMKVADNLNPACDYICCFSGTHESLIAEKYKVLNAYVSTLIPKSKIGSEKCKRVKAILRRIVKYDINCVDLNDFEEIREFSINNDLNQNDKDDKHIINTLISRMFEHYSKNTGNHIHIVAFLSEIVGQCDFHIDDKNMSEIELILAEMMKKGPRNQSIKTLHSIIENQKIKQVLQRVLIDESQFDALVKEEDLENLYVRTYSTIYCMLESNNASEEEIDVLYKLTLTLDKILDRVVIKLKRIATDLEALMPFRPTDDNHESLGELFVLLDSMVERVTQSRIVKNSSEAKTKLLNKFDIPSVYAPEVVSRIILPSSYSTSNIQTNKIITIDNASTPDLDDALSLVINEEDKYLLEVHIANVGKILLANPFLIEEILKRCTSIYCGNDYIVHMFPEILSTNYCSLIAGETRDVITNRFKINRDGIVEEYSCFENTISVSKKFSYRQVSMILKDKLFDSEYSMMLRKLSELTRLLKSKYIKNIEIYEQVHDSSILYGSQSIIEELAILTNRQMSGLAEAEKNIYPFVHRTHEDGERAVYSREPGFHYGLNVDHYTHFTAPIRRIIDAILQMILMDLKFKSQPTYKTYSEWETFIRDHLDHINERTTIAKQHTKRYMISSQYINGTMHLTDDDVK